MVFFLPIYCDRTHNSIMDILWLTNYRKHKIYKANKILLIDAKTQLNKMFNTVFVFIFVHLTPLMDITVDCLIAQKKKWCVFV